MKRDGYIDGLYYFTMNTLDRKPFFRDPDLCELFMLGTELTMNHYGFDLEAYCVLPDHVHLLITLPDGVYDYSQILQDIRHVATRSIRYHCKKLDLILWSRGYWTHTIQSPRDLQTHYDYIHYNPVQHGYVESIDLWLWSSVDPESHDKEIKTRLRNITALHRVGYFFGE